MRCFYAVQLEKKSRCKAFKGVLSGFLRFNVDIFIHVERKTPVKGKINALGGMPGGI